MTPSDTRSARPLILHVVHRFDVGGMENGVVNLINRLPEALADHAILALTEAAPGFTQRLKRPGVRVLALHKPPGPLLRFLPTLYRQFRALRPTVVHTRNVGTLEAQLAAMAARVPVRIHGEHGWDVGDLAGENRSLLRVRRVLRHAVHHQIALSTPTQRYLVERVGVPQGRVTNICNGVDIERFHPPGDRAAVRAGLAAGDPVAQTLLAPDAFIVGAVGRLAEVKNPLLLVAAFAAVRRRNAAFANKARLALIGDGQLLSAVRAQVQVQELSPVTWLPGSRDDVPACLQAFDLLCLPSLAEGISNAILEAMASGLPVIATDVGGNQELVTDGLTGTLVPSGEIDAMADAIETHFTNPSLAAGIGAAARDSAVRQFSIGAMVDQYHGVYARQLTRIGLQAQPAASAAHSMLDT